MIRVNALRNVAFMKNEKSFRDWTIVKLPRKSMRDNANFLPTLVSYENPTVSEVVIVRTIPQPTCFCLNYVIPESLLNRLLSISVRAWFGAMITNTFSSIDRLYEVSFSAFTFSFDHRYLLYHKGA